MPADTIFIPHQANVRLIEKMARGIGCRVHMDTVRRIGNAAPASVLFALEQEWSSPTRKTCAAQPIHIGAFGAGWVVAVIQATMFGILPTLSSEDIEAAREKSIELFAKSDWSKK